MSRPAHDRTRVIGPPPVIFGLGLVAGLALELVPALRGLEGRLLAGAPLVAAGLALDLWALLAFARMRTTINPFGGTTAIVEQGPYRFSRNPMYVGMTLSYVGVCVMFGLLGALLLLPLVLVAVDVGVVRREERYLDAKFGEAYRAYRTRVRRWL